MGNDRKPGYLWLSVLVLVAAAAFCLAALLGWGGGLPESAAQAPSPSLPVLPDDLASGAVALDEDSALLLRPLFHSSRRPQPYRTRAGEEEAGTAAALRLSGVVITPGASLATLRGEGGLSVRLRLGGEAVQGWQLLELSPRQATVSGPHGVQTLLLAVHEERVGDGALAPSGNAGPQAIQPAAAPVPAAGAANDTPAPSASQIQAIRERIQARRRQVQQASGQNTDGNP